MGNPYIESSKWDKVKLHCACTFMNHFMFYKLLYIVGVLFQFCVSSALSHCTLWQYLREATTGTS